MSQARVFASGTAYLEILGPGLRSSLIRTRPDVQFLRVIDERDLPHTTRRGEGREAGEVRRPARHSAGALGLPGTP